MKSLTKLFKSIAPSRHAFKLIAFIAANLAIVAESIVSRSVTTMTLAFWLLAILAVIILLHPRSQRLRVNTLHAPFPLRQVIFLILITIATLAWFGTRLYHAHFDEQLTAYFSYSLPPIGNLDWFGVYPKASEWVSQFPIFYYILQKPLLLLWPSILMIRISTWPYTIGTVLILYLLIRRIRSDIDALLAAACYVFFAPQLYLGSLGLHFHSSTFFFLLALFSFIRLVQDRDYRSSVLLGGSLAASYMTYTASYLAGPFILTCMIIVVLKKREKEWIALFGRTLVIALVILLPLFIYAARVNNFFLQRIDQVSIFTGSWRAKEEQFHSLDEFTRVIATHSKDAVRSLFLPDIGGMGDYWFGHASFFEPVGAVLFVFGLCMSLYQSLRADRMMLFLLSAIGVTFTLSMLLTTHPPPFHRWSLAYPLIGCMVAQGVRSVQRIIQKLSRSLSLGNSAFLGITLLFVSTNVIHTYRMIDNDAAINSNDGITLAAYLNRNAAPNTPIFIAAFPIYHLGAELLFRTENRYPIRTNYLSNITDVTTATYIIVHRPDHQSLTLLFNRFPTAQQITTIPLRDHALFKLP